MKGKVNTLIVVVKRLMALLERVATKRGTAVCHYDLLVCQTLISHRVILFQTFHDFFS